MFIAVWRKLQPEQVFPEQYSSTSFGTNHCSYLSGSSMSFIEAESKSLNTFQNLVQNCDNLQINLPASLIPGRFEDFL